MVLRGLKKYGASVRPVECLGETRLKKPYPPRAVGKALAFTRGLVGGWGGLRPP
jgi:hypothetical protein